MRAGGSCRRERRSGSSPTATSSSPSARYGSTSTSKTETPRPRQARRILQQQFKAADANKDGYLEGKEQAAINAPQSPLAGLSEVIDRDGDGKIYLKELIDVRRSPESRPRARAWS